MKFIAVFIFLLHTILLRAAVPGLIQGKSVTDGQSIEIDLKHTSMATVIVFLSAACPCSDSHVPYLKKLKAEFPQISFVAIHSNMDEDAKTTETYFKNVNLPFNVLQDDKAKLADIFKAYKTPHAFIISNTQKILYEGGVTSSAKAHEASHFYLRDALQDLTTGKEIKVKEVRTLGCMISREENT